MAWAQNKIILGPPEEVILRRFQPANDITIERYWDLEKGPRQRTYRIWPRQPKVNDGFAFSNLFFML
jgi:hypothetical protein